jgi:hypothetical protein
VLGPGLPFSIITNGTCVNPLTFSIRDAVGLQTTATLVNIPGAGAPPTAPPPALNASPGNQNVAACGGKTVSVLLTGGTLPYNVSAATVNSVTPTVTPSTLTSPGYVQISGMVSPGAGSLVYNFVVADSSTPQQLTSFTITCTP